MRNGGFLTHAAELDEVTCTGLELVVLDVLDQSAQP